VQETSTYLGNTPAVCRSSYIHPRIIDLFEGGITIAEDIGTLGDETDSGALAVHGEPEHAVAALLRDPQAARMAHRRQRMASRAAGGVRRVPRALAPEAA